MNALLHPPRVFDMCNSAITRAEALIADNKLSSACGILLGTMEGLRLRAELERDRAPTLSDLSAEKAREDAADVMHEMSEAR